MGGSTTIPCLKTFDSEFIDEKLNSNNKPLYSSVKPQTMSPSSLKASSSKLNKSSSKIKIKSETPAPKSKELISDSSSDEDEDQDQDEKPTFVEKSKPVRLALPAVEDPDSDEESVEGEESDEGLLEGRDIDKGKGKEQTNKFPLVRSIISILLEIKS